MEKKLFWVLIFGLVCFEIFPQDFLTENKIFTEGDLVFYQFPHSKELVKLCTDRGACVVLIDSDKKKLDELRQIYQLNLKIIVESLSGVDCIINKYGRPDLFIVCCINEPNPLAQLSTIISSGVKNIIVEFTLNALDSVEPFLISLPLKKGMKFSYLLKHSSKIKVMPFLKDLHKLCALLRQEKIASSSVEDCFVQLFLKDS